MKVEFINGDGLVSKVWEELATKMSDVKNKFYNEIFVEVGTSMNMDRSALFNRDRCLVLNLAGMDGDVVDMWAKDGRKKIDIPVKKHDEKKMVKEGWKPIKNSKGDIILAYTKPPFFYCCVDFRYNDMSKPVKVIMDWLFKYTNKMPKYVAKFDIDKTAKQFEEIVKKGHKNSLVQAKKSKEQLLKEVKDLTNRLSTSYNKIRIENNKLSLLKTLMGEKVKIDVKKKFDGIMKIRGVRGIGIEGEKIVVLTNPLTAKVNYCTGRPAEEYNNIKSLDVGSFKITWGVGEGIRIHNLGKPVKWPFDHPHVEDGVPCWGNMAEIEKLASEMEIEAVIQMILEYLQTVEASDWYVNVNEWQEEMKK